MFLNAVRSSRPTALTHLERVTGYAFMFLISAATTKLLPFKTGKSDGGNGGSEPNLYKAKCTSLIAHLFATLQIDANTCKMILFLLINLLTLRSTP